MATLSLMSIVLIRFNIEFGLTYYHDHACHYYYRCCCFIEVS